MSTRKMLIDQLFGTAADDPPDIADFTPPLPPPLDLDRLTGGGGNGPAVAYENRFLYIIPGTGFVPLWRRRWIREMFNYCFGDFTKQWEPVRKTLEVWKVPVEVGPDGEMLLSFDIGSDKRATVGTLKQMQQAGEVIVPMVVVVTCELPDSPCDIWPNNVWWTTCGQPIPRFWNAPLSSLPLDDHWPARRSPRIPFETDTGEVPTHMPALDLVFPANMLFWASSTPVPNVNEIGVMAGAFHTGEPEVQNIF